VAEAGGDFPESQLTAILQAIAGGGQTVMIDSTTYTIPDAKINFR